jgi:hypothetical protein
MVIESHGDPVTQLVADKPGRRKIPMKAVIDPPAPGRDFSWE